MHLGLRDGPFVLHNLISAQKSPVPLPKFQMAPRIKISMSSESKKGTQIYCASLKKSRQTNPLQIPQRGPYGEKYPLTGHFYISLNISLFIFPSGHPVREPPPCSLTGFPWTGILHHQSHWSICSTIYSCMSAGIPKKEPSCIHMGKNIRSPPTQPHADGRRTYYGVRPGSPRGWN